MNKLNSFLKKYPEVHKLYIDISKAIIEYRDDLTVIFGFVLFVMVGIIIIFFGKF